MRIKQERSTVNLCEGPITEIIQHPKKKDSVLITGAEGKVSVFKLEPFQLESEFKIFNCFSTCIHTFKEGVCVGSSNGELVHMDLQGLIIKRRKISNDSISSVVECDDFLVVIGFDGIVRFINKETFQAEKQINLEEPLWDAQFFQNKIYVAGNPSFEIDCSTFSVKKMKRQDHFEVFEDRLYSCSDQKGLTCLKNNSNSYIPCNFILPLHERLLLFSQECVAEVIHKHQMQWKCHRIREIQKGVAITSGCAINDMIVLGDNQGHLYRLQYQISRSQDRKQQEYDTDQDGE